MAENCYLKDILPGTSGFMKEDTRKRCFLAPAKIIKTTGSVTGADNLVGKAETQSLIAGTPTPCIMYNPKGTNEHAGILVDYGAELHGCIRIVISTAIRRSDGRNVPVRARIRFGESVSEAVTPLGTKNSTNDHAIRDSVIDVAFMSHQETGETGFRFFYFELLDEDVTLRLESLTAVLIFNDLPYIGSFKSSDSLLDEIWRISAYTVHLNLQEYLWDGIKRDRIVWLGDMNTEIATNFAVFGDNEVVRRSLEFGVKTTPLPGWMNGIPSYSFWWLLNLHKLYMHTGDKAFVLDFKDYIVGLTEQILALVTPDGEVLHDTARGFVDWSTRGDDEARRCGFWGMLGMTLKTIPTILQLIGKQDLLERCTAAYDLISKRPPLPTSQKIGAALLSLGGLCDPVTIDRDYLCPDGVRGYSTFMGYSILNAKALAGNIAGGVDAIREYWGAMVKLGATTFWEDFDIDWTSNCTRIDEFPTDTKNDIHGDFGKYCYIGLRHSLCHGWASGPCPWLTQNVLGIHVVEPGMKKILIKPCLCDLEFASGSVPTPSGKLSVYHKKLPDGSVKTEVNAPEGIEIVLEDCGNA